MNKYSAYKDWIEKLSFSRYEITIANDNWYAFLELFDFDNNIVISAIDRENVDFIRQILNRWSENYTRLNRNGAIWLKYKTLLPLRLSELIKIGRLFKREKKVLSKFEYSYY